MNEAEQLLAELQKIASARLRACNVAAKHAGLVLVDARRLEQLEALCRVTKEAFEPPAATMTRDYKDVQARGDDHYNGKQFLIRRHEGEAVCRALSDLNAKSLPTGCFVHD